MRLLLLGASAVALSGCSWFSQGGSNHYQGQSNYGYYSGGEACCESGKALSRWNLEGAVGTEFIVGGDALTGSEVTPAPGVVAVDQEMKDVYDRGMRYELGGSYALSPNRKVTLMGSYASAEGTDITLGNDGGGDITGTVSDYERYGVEAGLRQYFTPQNVPVFNSLRPYIEGKVGAAKVKSIDLENAMQGGGAFNGGTVALYESSWVPTGAGMIGIEAPVFKRATLALESGIRYTGAPKSDTTFLGAGNALENINNGGESWTVPVMLRGRYRF